MFEVAGNGSNFIVPQNIHVQVKSTIAKPDSAHHATTATNSGSPLVVKNMIHSLFSDCSVTENSTKKSPENGKNAHKASIDKEFSHN